MSSPGFALTPVTCRVVIQGETVADGADPAANPSALSGLEVTWGRATTVDQPDTGTCAFTLEDVSGDQAFARIAAVGRTVDVWATGTSSSGETAETIPDPTFTLPDGAPPPWILRATPAAASVVGGALRLMPAGDPNDPVNSQVRILPAPPGGADPAAWDLIPTAQPGQRWNVALDVVATAPGATMRVGIEWWSDAGHTRHGPKWLGDLAPATVGRHTWTVTPPPEATGQWLSLIVKSATGWAWDDVPASLTWDNVDPSWTWDSMAGVTLDNVSLVAPVNPLIRDVLVFSGRITDATSGWDLAAGAARVDVTASDFTAELANRDVGAEPWPSEPLSARAARIVAASGSPVQLRIDPKPGAAVVSRLDVDRQQVFPMLGALASGVDAVLWAAVHATTGQYLWIEDMTTRPAVLTLAKDADGIVRIVPGGSGSATGIALSACDVDLEPVRWTQTNSDMATRAVVTYQDQTTTPDTTERTVSVVDVAAEDPTGPYGVRRVSVASQLTTAAAATELADAVLTRLARTGGWRVGGLVYHVETFADAAQVATALTLLDGTTRIGAPILLDDLPPWSPADSDRTSGYLEGGRYTYQDGAWILSLIMSSAAGVGESIRWDQADPSWRWDDFDPAISWNDLRGVGAPVATGRISR